MQLFATIKWETELPQLPFQWYIYHWKRIELRAYITQPVQGGGGGVSQASYLRKFQQYNGDGMNIVIYTFNK